MSFSLLDLSIVGIGFLLLLFGLAHATEQGKIPHRLTRHPIIYILALGTFVSAWGFYGSIGLANQFGFGFLAYYLGICGAFLLAPVFLVPVLRISRAYQLSSLADLLAFRYRSQLAATITTLFSIAGMISLIALQIKSVAHSVQILAPGTTRDTLGFLFCIGMVIFTILFGARAHRNEDRNEGLVVAMAFATLVKLAALLIVGGIAIYQVFGGFSGLDEWMQTQGPRISTLSHSIDDISWRALLLCSFASVLVMPHMYQLAFTENRNANNLYRASWGVPLLLLFLSLPVPAILWASISMGAPTIPDFYLLGLTISLNSPILSMLVFVGGLAASSAMIIITVLALSGMILNHLVLPVYQPKPHINIYYWLKWVKRGIISVLMLLSYIFYQLLNDGITLTTLGILSFTAMLQLLPGVLGVLYWPIGNRLGLNISLGISAIMWVICMPLPLLFNVDILSLLPNSIGYRFNMGDWQYYTFGILTFNATIFGLFSLISPTSPQEESASRACSLDALAHTQRRELKALSSEEFIQCLTAPLGEQAAKREVHKALIQLDLPETELRPYALRRLRNKIEANLSGLMGPHIAQDMVRKHLSYKPHKEMAAHQDIYHIEKTLEDYQSRLTGLAAELDSLRRYHRQTLQNLPIAACSLGSDDEILMWNQAMMALTHIQADHVIGSNLSALSAPWGMLFQDLISSEDLHQHRKRVELFGRPNWFSLHKSLIGGSEDESEGIVILIEDQTEMQLLEDELIHTERLASVGRLAAGVAHEIGNPVTGIACLAQNLKLETDNPEILETAEQVIEQTKRISRILQSLMNFSRAGNHSQSSQLSAPANIRQCSQEAINLLSLSDYQKTIDFENNIPENIQVTGDEQRLVQVFINLISNAIDASPDGSVIRITGHQVEHSAIIEVIDEGCGIPPQQLEQIFEPFYTTKGPERGTGLGLALVYSIIEEHYGQLQVNSPAYEGGENGTRFTIQLPIHLESEAL